MTDMGLTRGASDWGRAALALLLCVVTLLWSIGPATSHTLEGKVGPTAVPIMTAEHGHSHGPVADLFSALHGHSHDAAADHDHSPALPAFGAAPAFRSHAAQREPAPPSRGAPSPRFRIERPPRG